MTNATPKPGKNDKPSDDPLDKVAEDDQHSEAAKLRRKQATDPALMPIGDPSGAA